MTTDFRLQKMILGADAAINILKMPVERIKNFTNGELAHVVFTLPVANRLWKTELATCDMAAHLCCKGDLSFYRPALHPKETTLLSNRNALKSHFEFVMTVLREKKLLISKQRPLSIYFIKVSRLGWH